MKLTAQEEYGLRCLLRVAEAGESESLTIPEIGRAEALSIAYVAIENVLTSELHAWRPFVVFGFGLLHGMGFAGVLQEIGMPRSEFLTALVSFNVGVELGQLAVITLAFALTGLWFRNRSWYRGRIVVPASLAIAATGLYWTVERVIGFS